MSKVLEIGLVVKFITTSWQPLKGVFLPEQLCPVLPLGSIPWILNKSNNDKDNQNKDKQEKIKRKIL